VYATGGNLHAAATAHAISFTSRIPRVARDASAHTRSARSTRIFPTVPTSSAARPTPSARSTRRNLPSRADTPLWCAVIPARSKNGHTRDIVPTASVSGVRGRARYARTSRVASPIPRYRGSTITREIVRSKTFTRCAASRLSTPSNTPGHARPRHHAFSTGRDTTRHATGSPSLSITTTSHTIAGRSPR
jgi:hypothetical protein